MTEQHTPRPWEIGFTPNNEGSISIMAEDEDGRWRVATVDDYAPAHGRNENHWPLEMGQANARLIKNAPDLKAILEDLVGSYSDHPLLAKTDDHLRFAEGPTIGQIRQARAILDAIKEEQGGQG